MEEQKFPPFLPILLTGFFIALVGWAGLAYTVFMLDPELPPRWLFFFLLFMALCGTALPVVAFLNRRFPAARRPVRVCWCGSRPG